MNDVAWLTLAATLVLLTVWQAGRLVWTIATDPQVQVTGGGAVLGFLVTVVWFLTIFWVAVGAWRRSVWGCPFTHAEGAHPDRRCQRHALASTSSPIGEVPAVDAVDAAGGDRGAPGGRDRGTADGGDRGAPGGRDRGTVGGSDLGAADTGHT